MLLDILHFPVAGAVRWLLWGLLLLWAGLLIGGLLLGRPDAARRNRLPLPVRMASSTVLLAAALVWWRAGLAGGPLERFGLWIAVGMAFGLLGDLFMAGLIVARPKHVIFGMLAFGAGHIAYLLAFRQAAGLLGLNSGPAWLGSVALYLVVGVLLWLRFVRAPARGPVLNYGTLVYSLLLAVVAGAAAALAVQQPLFIPLALGALLFIASDLLVGSELMRRTAFPWIGDVIWLTYSAAQMLIVYSSAAALAALSGQ